MQAADQQHQKEPADQQAKAQAAEQERQKALEAEKAKELADDTRMAKMMDVTLDTYQWGKKYVTGPYVICQDKVEDTARYGARSDWIPKYGWIIGADRKSYTIKGFDIRVKNVFGTEEYVDYFCSVTLTKGGDPNSVSAWTATVLSVTPRNTGN